jgi:hypothetical protein
VEPYEALDKSADKIAESLRLGHGRVALEIKGKDGKANSHGTPTKTQRTGDERKNRTLQQNDDLWRFSDQ